MGPTRPAWPASAAASHQCPAGPEAAGPPKGGTGPGARTVGMLARAGLRHVGVPSWLLLLAALVLAVAI